MLKLDEWAEQQPDKPGRSAAIHRLVETGLKATLARGSSFGAAFRAERTARDMAEETALKIFFGKGLRRTPLPRRRRRRARD